MKNIHQIFLRLQICILFILSCVKPTVGRLFESSSCYYAAAVVGSGAVVDDSDVSVTISNSNNININIMIFSLSPTSLTSSIFYVIFIAL